MRRMGTMKLLLLFFALGYGIFFGVDLATKGSAQVDGFQSVPAAAAAAPAPTPKPAAGEKVKSAASQTTAVRPSPQPAVQPPVQEATLQTSFINRLTNRTGDVLRRLASLALRAITSLIQTLIG